MKIILFATFFIPCFSLFSQAKKSLFTKMEVAVIDSLNKVIASEKNDTVRVRLILEIVEGEANDKVWPIFNQQANILAEDLVKNKDSQIKYIGKKSLASTLNNIALIFFNQGDIKKSIEYYHESLKLREEIYDSSGIGEVLVNLGGLYRAQQDYILANKYLQQSLNIYEKLKNKIGLANSLRAIGRLNEAQKNYPVAMDYFIKSLKLYELMGKDDRIALIYNNIGKIYFEQGEMLKAHEFYNKSLDIGKTYGDKMGMARTYRNIGLLYEKQENISKAIEAGKQSLKLAEELGFPKEISDAALLLDKIYKKQKRWKDAYYMHNLYTLMRDSISNEEIKKSAVKEEMKYEYEKQEVLKEAEHKQEILLASVEKEQQKIISYSIAGGFIITLAFAGVVGKRLRVTRQQKRIIEDQKLLVDEKNKDITDSINYAKNIQHAILPYNSRFKPFKEFFVYFLPRDIVSGDFYWLTQKENKVFLAVADCTGHGVPGAFMSMIGSSIFTHLVNEKGLLKPAEILSEANVSIRYALNQAETNNHDGMEAALICYDLNKPNSIIFAGANRPLYIIRKRNSEPELIEIKSTKAGIGGVGSEDRKFSEHHIDLKEGDTIYLTTDGLADQFGGDTGKKFKTANLKKLLLSISEKSLEQQKDILKESFQAWRGNIEQVDDVLVIGIKI